jgi:hypothetical protein
VLEITREGIAVNEAKSPLLDFPRISKGLNPGKSFLPRKGGDNRHQRF